MIRLAIGLCLASILILACKSKSDKSGELDFEQDFEQLSKYFSAAPTGVVSANQTLNFVLTTPLESEPTEAQLQRLINIIPTVNGSTEVRHKSVIVFTPDKPFRPNQKYRVQIDLNQLGDPNLEGEVDYNIATLPQEWSIDLSGFFIYDAKDMSYVLEIKTADGVRPNDLLKCFDSNASTINIESLSDKAFKIEFRFLDNDASLPYISYDGKPIYIEDKGKIALPEQDNSIFDIVLSRYDADSKSLHLDFSQIIDQQQDLIGLVKLNDKDINYRVDRNRLTIMLSQEFNESKGKFLVSGGIRSSTGQKFGRDFSYEVDLSVRLPAMAFLDGGHYLPSSSDFKVPIKTRELRSIKLSIVEVLPDQVPSLLIWNEIDYIDHYTLRRHGKLIYNEKIDLKGGEPGTDGWSVYAIDLSQQVKRNPGSIYYISADFGPTDTRMACSESLKNIDYKYKIPDASFYTDKRAYFYSYHYYSDYSYTRRDDPCHISFYQQNRSIDRTFICTDFSIITKQAGPNYHVAVSDLMDLSPTRQAKITMYDLQGGFCAEGLTDAEGLCKLEAHGGCMPHVIRVEKGKQVTYMGLGYEATNSLTDLNVSGNRSQTDLGYFVYSERAVYRPGDDIHFNLMVNSKIKLLPKGLPVVMRLFDSNNSLIEEAKQNIDLDRQQIYTFKTSTSHDALTGRYTCEFAVGTETIRKSILVETIRPNSTTVRIKPDHFQNGRIEHHQFLGQLTAQYLTGFKLARSNVTGKGHFRPLIEPFEKFKDFTFGVAKEEYPSYKLFEIVTDDNGEASFSSTFDFKPFNTPINISVDIETSLPGGGMNKEGQSFKIYPFESYVGVKNIGGNGWGGNYFTSDKITINTVNVNRSGNLLNYNNTIEYTIYKHRDYWWVDKYNIHQVSYYRRFNNWNKVLDGQKAINGRQDIEFLAGSLEKGTYKIEVKDQRSGQLSLLFFVVYESGRPIPGQGPDILAFELDTDECTAGDNVQIKLPGIQGAKALISVERGEEVLKQFWGALSDAEQVVDLNIPEGWAPNVYIHLTIIQPYMQSNNDLPLRLYGVQGLKVNPRSRNIEPVIKTSRQFESNRTYDLQVSEANNKQMYYTVSIVDEGLLNITGYKTPDPVNHFGGIFPLLVRTWDIYKYLMRFFKVKLAGVLSIGGDDTYNPDAIPEISRFKPMSMHLGPYKLAAGETKTHKIDIPNYIGKVRIMVVACNDGKFGSDEAYVPVRNPIMLQSQFPRSLNVTDEIKLPVTIFKEDATIDKATLTAASTKGMLSGLKASTIINLRGKEEYLHEYDVKVLDKSGPLDVSLTLEGGGKTMNETTQLAVHYPNTYSTESQQIIIAPNETYEFVVDVKGYKEAFRSMVTIGGARLPEIASYSEALMAYPYGCLEQVVSAGFAQLYLDKILNLTPEANRKRLDYINYVINTLKSYRNPSGQFAYWQGGSINAWADLYAGDFLIECVKMSYISDGSNDLSSWRKNQQVIAQRWRLNEVSTQRIYESESLIQAYRLYLLAKMGVPSKSAMNAFITENTSKHQLTWWLIAGAYHLSGYETKALELTEKARNMSSDGSLQSNWSYLHFGGMARDLALITEVLSFIPVLSQVADQYYNAMVDILDQSRYVNTHTKGFAFKAVYAFFGDRLGKGDVVSYDWTEDGQARQYNHSAYQPANYPVSLSNSQKRISIKNTGSADLYFTAVSRFISDDLFQPSTSNNLNMQVTYLRANEVLGSSFSLSRGEYLEVFVTIQNKSGIAQSNMALNYRMPSGIELINPAIYKSEVVETQDQFTYQSYKDDRVYTFFDLEAGQSKTFKFRGKAAFLGDFYLPAVNCENMYNGEVYARSKAGRVKIK